MGLIFRRGTKFRAHYCECIAVCSYTQVARVKYLLLRGIAQLGSAPALGAGGREFESPCPDHSKTYDSQYK